MDKHLSISKFRLALLAICLLSIVLDIYQLQKEDASAVEPIYIKSTYLNAQNNIIITL